MPIEVMLGDIAALDVDAIVNAAKHSLLGGGGVDGAIHQAAGPQLLEECRLLNGCETGEAKMTQGYNLPASWVIHTVGPVWHGGYKNEPELLKSCYQKSLKLAADKGLKSIAFPAISCGVYRYPREQAASIAIDTTQTFLTESSSIESVIFACYSDPIFKIYRRLLDD